MKKVNKTATTLRHNGAKSRFSTPRSVAKPVTTNYELRTTNSRIIKLELAILALLAVIFAFQYSMSNFPKFREAVLMATTKKPETFTELYFEKHTELPKLVEKGREYQFAFTIHNLEYRDMDYIYTVYLERDGVRTPLSTGSAYLRHDEFKTISEVAGPFKQLRTKVVIELDGRSQSIAYWLEQ